MTDVTLIALLCYGLADLNPLKLSWFLVTGNGDWETEVAHRRDAWAWCI
nr:MAG TPA: hypothetical protein [Caudoviricetes sp.]